jgi:hypothetical protein
MNTSNWSSRRDATASEVFTEACAPSMPFIGLPIVLARCQPPSRSPFELQLGTLRAARRSLHSAGHGRIEINANAVERAIRPLALRRNNHLTAHPAISLQIKHWLV